MGKDFSSALRPAIVMTILFAVLLGLAYPLAMTGIGQALFPTQANGSLVTEDGRVIGSTVVGQAFTVAMGPSEGVRREPTRGLKLHLLEAQAELIGHAVRGRRLARTAWMRALTDWSCFSTVPRRPAAARRSAGGSASNPRKAARWARSAAVGSKLMLWSLTSVAVSRAGSAAMCSSS